MGICVSHVGEHISLGIWVSNVGEHTSLGICVSHVREHISVGICVFQMGEHISLGICVFQVGEDISLGICVFHATPCHALYFVFVILITLITSYILYVSPLLCALLYRHFSLCFPFSLLGNPLLWSKHHGRVVQSRVKITQG